MTVGEATSVGEGRSGVAVGDGHVRVGVAEGKGGNAVGEAVGERMISVEEVGKAGEEAPAPVQPVSSTTSSHTNHRFDIETTNLSRAPQAA